MAEVPQETRKSRLMITKMVLENFKSYAGQQEIGPFHKRFSSIVGPNGSGKSNVIDALLFVFGKRAKQLRLNKVSELIHKSASFPSLEYAKVSVHFQLIFDHVESDDDYEVLPDSSFVVTRTAFQNNQSKYTLDSRSTTYTDVGLLLRQHGIDLDNNRFLILQGEVEQIAMMKPKALTPHEEGLLEYLEDIIGSNRFVEQIAAASKELDEITEMRVEKVNRLKIAEKERDNLSGSKLEAEAFMEKEKDIRRRKNELYQVFEHDSNDKATAFSEKLEKANEKLAYEKSKLVDSESRLSVIQGEYERIKADHDAVNAELQKSSTQYDAFERNDVKLQEDMKHAKALIKKQQAAIAKEAKKETDCEKEADDTLVQMGKYETLIADFEAKKLDEEAQLETIMEGLQEATKELRASLETAQTQLLVQEKAVASLLTEKELAQSAASLLQARANSATKAAAATQEKLAKLCLDREAACVGLEAMQGPQREVLEGEVAATEGAIRACAEQEAGLQTAVRSAITQAELGKASLATQQSSKGSSAVVQKVLQAARKGGALSAAGVHGRLGDLGCIPAEFDVAVSTACGLLDYIVVDSAEGGQACINYLREMNLGRASFVVLDQMQDWAARMDRPVQVPAGARRLFDLVEGADAAVRPAFYMALKDTLVAKDLDQAVAMAYQGDRAMWRVVTLDGNLIDTSGAMSGGGKEGRSGGMKLTSGRASAGVAKSARGAAVEDEYSAEAVRALEERVAQLQHELSQCRSHKAANESKLKDLQKQLRELATGAEKARMAVARYAEQEAELAARLKQTAADCELSAGEKEQLAEQQSRLEDIEAQVETVAPNLRTMQTEVASLQRRILSVGGPKLAKVQAKIDSYSAQLDTLSGSMATKTVEESSARKQAQKAAALRVKAEGDCAKAEAKLADLVAQQKEMETDALEVVNAVESARERMVDLEAQLQSISKEFHDLKALVNKVKTVELDLTVERERIASELKECKSMCKKWRLEAEAVRAEHTDEQREFLAVVQAATAPAPTPAPSSDGGSPMKVACSPQKGAVEADALEALPVLVEEELSRLDSEELKRDINIMEAQKNKMKSSVNMSALLEYMKKDASYRSRLLDLEQITEARNAVRRTYEDLRRQRLEAFMAGFGVISLKLKEMYQMITLGGDAELELLDSLDPFSEGIVFSVRPPKKSWKNISNLSGGEKTLSSLALVFALHHYKPTPLYVMDEIDAALDFKNVSIVANYIKDRTKDAQFIIISLRNNMFELADRLVGIYKTNDATKSVTINPKLFASAAAGEPVKTIASVKANPLGDVTNKVN
ncbi:RecF/RecN/SMC [Ochromonadaceae sp. CCMP2298]|nr:RecF/RecN/SMC [Ochromonadaceae sp. CCMP2298]